jgi:hypothetical protein
VVWTRVRSAVSTGSVSRFEGCKSGGSEVVEADVVLVCVRVFCDVVNDVGEV